MFRSSKISSFKQDIAPIGFYFDIFSTPLFNIPVLPIPLRIDKILIGEPTLFIFPNWKKLARLFKKLKIYIDYALLYKIGIENILNYARSKQSLITRKNFFPIDNVRKWWQASINFTTCNPDLASSFTFLISQFLYAYADIDNKNLEKEDYISRLIEYCDSVIQYFRNKIESNTFFGDGYELEKLYLEQRKKYFPLEVKIQIYNHLTKKTDDMTFVPYLIYDDLLDSFHYNKKLLEEAKEYPINLKVYEDNRIINKTSTIDDIRIISSKIELKELNIKEIIEKY